MSTITEQMPDITKATMNQKDLDEFKALYPSNPQIQGITLDQVDENTPGVNGNWNDPLPSEDLLRLSHAQSLNANLSNCQMAIGYVVFDCLCLALGAVGLRAGVNSATIEAIGGAVAPVASKLEVAIAKMAAEGASKLDIAKGVFEVLKTIYSGGMLGAVFSAFTSNLTWWDAMLYGITGTATIIAALATDGAAFAAEVAILLATFGFLVSDSVKAGQACG